MSSKKKDAVNKKESTTQKKTKTKTVPKQDKGLNLDIEKEREKAKTMAERLKMEREKSGLSQKNFAESLQVPLGTYQQWESGRRTPPEYVESLIQNAVTQLRFYSALSRKNNGIVLAGEARHTLWTSGCPFEVKGDSKIVSHVDELGKRHYYLAVGEIDPSEVNSVNAWLHMPFDDEYYEWVQEKLLECGTDEDADAIREEALKLLRDRWDEKRLDVVEKCIQMKEGTLDLIELVREAKAHLMESMLGKDE